MTVPCNCFAPGSDLCGVAALEVAEQVGEGLGGLFFDRLGCRDRLSGLGFGSENRRGDGLRGGFSDGFDDRLWNGSGRDFLGGQGFSDVFFSHSGLLSILP